jgi:hypothetical protein
LGIQEKVPRPNGRNRRVKNISLFSAKTKTEKCD